MNSAKTRKETPIHIVAVVSIIRGKSSTAIAQEDIRSGQLGR